MCIPALPMKLGFVLCLVLFAGSSLASLAQTPPRTPALPPPLVELLGEKSPDSPADEEVLWESRVFLPVFSSDRRRLAWREKRGKLWAVAVNGQQQGGLFEKIAFLTFSPDGRRFAFAGMRGKTVKLVIDGQETPTFEDAGRPVFSPDSKRLAYVYKDAGKFGVVIDGVRSPVYDKALSPIFSPDSQRVAYGATHGGESFLVVNGTETPTPSLAYVMAFSPDSQRLVWGFQRNNLWLIMFDGKETGPGSDDLYTIGFSPGGKHFAYLAKKGNSYSVVVDGVPGPYFEVIGGMTFSADGEHFAYGGSRRTTGLVKSERGHGSVVVDGKAGPTFDGDAISSGLLSAFFNQYRNLKVERYELTAEAAGVSRPAMSHDGHRVAYSARRGDSDYVVFINGEAQPPLKFIFGDPVISSDGEHVAYVGLKGDSVVAVLDGAQQGEIPATKGELFVYHPTMSPNGRRFAYVIGHGGLWFRQGKTTKAKRRVVLDGKAGAEYDVFFIQNLLFSPDSAHLAYEVHGLYRIPSRVNVDTQEGTSYDEIIPQSLMVSPAEGFTYIARQERKFYRVAQPFR